MTECECYNCPKCNSETRMFDHVWRIVRSKNRKKTFVRICRVRCLQCGYIHRVLPKYLIPYKHYDKNIIEGVIEGLITQETLGYEDYPSETTIFRWIKEFESQKFPG